MTTIVAKAFGAAIIVAAGFAPIALAAPTHAAPCRDRSR